MIKNLAITGLNFLAGSTAGVIGATALVTLRFEGEYGDNNALGRLSSYATLASLNPGDPHFGVAPESWISSFVRTAPSEPEFAHIIAAYTVAFQRWAREPVSKAVVVSSSKHHVQLAIPWLRSKSCSDALILAIKFAELAELAATTTEQKYSFFQAFTQFLSLSHRNYLAPNTVRFALAALERGIPVSALSQNTIQLGWGARQIRLQSSFTGDTSNIGSTLARDKLAAKTLLQANQIPVPRGLQAHSIEEADKAAEELDWPVVVKPSSLDQGLGVTPGITNSESLHAAFQYAQKLQKGPVLIEEHIDGADHRMLVVKGQLLMTTRRIPAGVTGDGTSTIKQLIASTNRDPLRGKSKRSLMQNLKLDEAVIACLTEQGLSTGDVPVSGQFVALKKIANISTGGTAVDVSDMVHPDNIALALRTARLIGLDIAGVDFLCSDISQSYREVGGAICEVNAQPGFRPHWLSDPKRDINGEVLDILTGGGQLRIPTAAITGTNGKSTTAKMLHHMWQASGKVTGVCTTAGTWVGDVQISRKNLSGHPGAQLLLQDPAVESAVIEIPRKGLIVFGHPCDHYDVAALLNIADDHIGVDGINSMEDMARLKSQVITRARKAVVLNADDSLCMDMQKYISAPETILTARHKSNAALSTHLNNKGRGAFIKGSGDKSCLVIAQGDRELEVLPVADIPATEGGLIEHNILNALWASSIAWAQGLPLEAIRTGLASFTSDVTNNPGRYNHIDGFPFGIMIDYAHNTDSASTVIKYVEGMDITGRRILLSSKLGNRHRHDFTKIAPGLTRVFDEIMVTPSAKRVRSNPEYAGDDPESTMLNFAEHTLLEQGQDRNCVHTTKDLKTAVDWAMDIAEPGDFVLILGDIDKTLPLIEKHAIEK